MSASRVDTSAPGKMLLGGEYAVLDGAPAIACAVQRRAFARWVDDPDHPAVARPLAHEAPRFPESAAARRFAEEKVGRTIEGELAMDVSALRSETQKLGVGSSAAAAAAAAGAVFASVGEDLEDAAVKQAVLRCALDGHADVAPRGSGVDVAASVLGGTLRYVRSPLEATPIAWPEGLVARVVWTGKAASTRAFLDQVAAFQEAEPEEHRRIMAALHAETGRFAKAFFGGDGLSVIAQVPPLVFVLQALTDASGAPIIEERLATIAQVATEHGGAAKPSGAGGGDVAIAFFSTEAQATSFAEDVPFEVLDVTIGGPGVAVA